MKPLLSALFLVFLTAAAYGSVKLLAPDYCNCTVGAKLSGGVVIFDCIGTCAQPSCDWVLYDLDYDLCDCTAGDPNDCHCFAVRPDAAPGSYSCTAVNQDCHNQNQHCKVRTVTTFWQDACECS